MKREDVEWRGMPAARYSAGGTAVVVVPARGGKISSLRMADGWEWLAQGDGRAPAPAPASFESAEMCGWDECAPTIERSRTARGTIAGDHGDAWCLPWQEVASDRLAVTLASVDVRFERAIAISADGTVTLSYRVTAGSEPAALLWAAHPLFRVGPRDRIVIDAQAPLWAVSGEQARREDRDPDASLNARRSRGDIAKFYTDPVENPRWARIDRHGGRGLRISWRGSAIRTVGVWIDRARIATENVVALEPATGWYDSLERAVRRRVVLTLATGESQEWSVEIASVPPGPG